MTGTSSGALLAVWQSDGLQSANCKPEEGTLELQLDSTLTCPVCGHVKTERMPTDACQWFYECEGCHTLLKPLPGDCCVFCSYGTVPCPPIQISGKSCCT